MNIRATTPCFVGLLLGITFTSLFWFNFYSDKQKEIEQQYGRKLADEKELTNKELQEKLYSLHNFDNNTIFWNIKTNLDGVLEIKDCKARTFLHNKVAIDGGYRQKEIPHGRYDYFTFVPCPESDCCLAVAIRPDTQCFLIHFTGNLPDRRKGIKINEDNSVSFY